MLMMGPCPNCGSRNAHSCEYDPEAEDSADVECEVARVVGDPLVGHCESCGCLFCTECRQEIPGASDKAVGDLPKVVEAHEKVCPELKPQRWAQLYGTTYVLVSVKGRRATLADEDDGHFDTTEGGGTHVARIGHDCGMTPEEMAKHLGERMRFDGESQK